MNARLFAIVLLASLFSSVGCVTNPRPLSDEQTSIPDLRLLGTWQASGPDKPEKKHDVVIVRKKDSKTLLHATAQDGSDSQQSDLFCTKIGNDCFVSMVQEIEGKTLYTFGKYGLADEKHLTLYALDTQFFTAAVNSKELKGKIEGRSHMGSDAMLDESPEHLRKFIQKHGEECFNKKIPIAMLKIKAAE